MTQRKELDYAHARVHGYGDLVDEITRLTAEFNETFAKMVVLKSKNAELAAELENEKKERLINANAGRMQKERAEAAEQQVAALVGIVEDFIFVTEDKPVGTIVDDAKKILSTLSDHAKKIQAVINAAKAYSEHWDDIMYDVHSRLLESVRDLES